MFLNRNLIDSFRTIHQIPTLGWNNLKKKAIYMFLLWNHSLKCFNPPTDEDKETTLFATIPPLLQTINSSSSAILVGWSPATYTILVPGICRFRCLLGSEHWMTNALSASSLSDYSGMMEYNVKVQNDYPWMDLNKFDVEEWRNKMSYCEPESCVV